MAMKPYQIVHLIDVHDNPYAGLENYKALTLALWDLPALGGKPLFIPPGKYDIAKTIQPLTRFAIRGAGIGCTTLVFPCSTTGIRSSLVNCSIDDLSIVSENNDPRTPCQCAGEGDGLE